MKSITKPSVLTYKEKITSFVLFLIISSSVFATECPVETTKWYLPPWGGNAKFQSVTAVAAYHAEVAEPKYESPYIVLWVNEETREYKMRATRYNVDTGIIQAILTEICPVTDKDVGSCKGRKDKLFGNPINSCTGSKSQSEIDFTGPGSYPIEVRRVYNSESVANSGFTFNVLRKLELHGRPVAAITMHHPSGQSSFFREASYKPSYGGTATYDSVREAAIAHAEAATELYNTPFSVSNVDDVARTYILRADQYNAYTGIISAQYTSLPNDEWIGDADYTWRLFAKKDENEVLNGWRHVSPKGIVEEYDLSGLLLSITQPSGLQHLYLYDDEDRVSSVTDSYGHQINITYDSNNRIQTITDPSGGLYSYAYDLNDNLVSVTYPNQATRQYHYENGSFPQKLTGITDENGDRYATYSYDTSGLAILTEHASTTNVDGAGNPIGQERYSFSYDSDTQTTVTDPIGTPITLLFEENLGVENLVSHTNQNDGKGYSQQFDDNNNLVSRTDEEGRTTTYTYNATNQRISKTEAAGTPEARTTNYEYVSPDTYLITKTSTPSVFSGANYDVLTNYDDSFNVSGITLSGFRPDGTPVSRSTTFQHNALGQVTQVDGPRSDVTDITTFTYYECTTGSECGQLASVTNALGHTASYDTYDANGRLLQMTEPNGLVANYTYHPRGWVTSVTQTPTNGNPRITTYAYDGVGQTTSITTPDGVVLTYTYDEAHDLRSINDNLGNSISYLYDPKGNRIQEDSKDPDGTLVRTVQTTYDIRDRISSINAAGSVTQLINDTVGNIVSETDPKQNTSTIHQYDALNRLTQTLDAFSNPSSYHYDNQSNLTQVTTPNGAVTLYEYDDFGNLLKETSADRGTITRTYDVSGNLLTETDARGVTKTFAYDALNRLTSIDYPGTDEDATLLYDNCPSGIGHLCTEIVNGSTKNYQYDAYGNIADVSNTVLSHNYLLQYSFNGANRLISKTYPSGRVATVTRDVVGRIASISTTVAGQAVNVLSGISYRGDGLMTGQTFGNGVTESRAYDLQGRLTNQIHSVATGRAYSYDTNSNILSISDSEGTRSFDYDALDRLLSAAYDSTSLGYNYDPNGNRLSFEINGAGIPYSYVPNSNRLDVIGSAMISLDAAGNTLVDQNGNRSFEYNQAGRLSKVIHSGSEVALYEYDTKGQRVKKITPSNKTIYHYDLDGKLLAESDENGNVQREYIYADNAPVAVVIIDGVTESIYYYHTDHLLTPVLLTDSTQSIVWKSGKDPFGGDAPVINLVENNLRFPGQYYDQETGLHYNYYRYYDPNTGRYITSDPIGLQGGLNTYAYVGGNPSIYADPYGLFQGPLSPTTTTTRLLPGLGPFGLGVYIGVLIGDALIPEPKSVMDGYDPDELPDNVVPFPGQSDPSETQGDKQCHDPDDCELWRGSLIIAEIKIKQDAQGAPPGANQIQHAGSIRARKKAWNKAVDQYNRKCPRKIYWRFRDV